MDPRTRSVLRWLAILVSLAWMAWAGWDQFAVMPEDAVQHHGSDVVKDRMKDCDGSFQQRYECKEAIVIQSGRDTFNNLVKRLFIVAGPAILLGILFAAFMPKARLVVTEDVHERADEWKSRTHASVRVPAHAPPRTRVEPTLAPTPNEGPAPAGNSAGNSDWKKKAQQHMGGKGGSSE